MDHIEQGVPRLIGGIPRGIQKSLSATGKHQAPSEITQTGSNETHPESVQRKTRFSDNMNPIFTKPFLGPIIAVFTGAAAFAAFTPDLRAQEESVEVLTRGPVHEAFADAVSYEATAGIIVTTKVPVAIEEMPPDEQPEGDNVTWIAGYWAWDDDENQFIWISGVWRNLPPGRQWVPGYWSDLGDGRFQWTSGYWASLERKTVSYIPTAPPANIDTGPNIAAPSREHTWIPGYWYWTEPRYVWRPGYWMPLRPRWTWVPPHHRWTPCGYVYVGGYWDHAISARGVIFAPVRFRQPVYTAVSYSFVPAVVVSLSVFSDHLFYRPHHHHYYFGDYYAPRYRESGFYASYTWTSGRHGYDPIYSYARWEHRGDPTWERRRYQDFEYFRDHEDARPPRTWAAMRGARSDQFNDGRNRKFASELSGYARQENGPRFRKIDDKRRGELVSQNREMRKFSQQRRETESRKPVAEAGKGKPMQREKLDPSPIKSRKVSELSEKEAPPPKRQANRGKKNDPPQGRNEQETDRKKPQVPGSNKTKPDERAAPGTKKETQPQRKRNPDAVPQPGKGTKPNGSADKVAPKPRQDTPRKEAQPQRKRNPDAVPQTGKRTQPKESANKVTPKPRPDNAVQPRSNPNRGATPAPKRPKETTIPGRPGSGTTPKSKPSTERRQVQPESGQTNNNGGERKKKKDQNE